MYFTSILSKVLLPTGGAKQSQTSANVLILAPTVDQEQDREEEGQILYHGPPADQL